MMLHTRPVGSADRLHHTVYVVLLSTKYQQQKEGLLRYIAQFNHVVSAIPVTRKGLKVIAVLQFLVILALDIQKRV